MRIRPDVELANSSDAGSVRTENEDYFLYCEPDDDEEFARRGRLMILTDGMGGHNGGAEASRLAAEILRDAFLRGDAPEPRAVLIEGFQRAHAAIRSHAAENDELRGMGTTCCAVILRHGKLYLGHVGDSRIYLLRDGVANQLTEDHTLVARMVRDGLLTPEQASQHEQRNVLTQALGMDSDTVSADFPPDPLEVVPGDIVLMCSDGLHGMVNAREIALTAAGQPLRDACQELVALANARGGPDNITVQMLGIRQVES